VAVEDFRREILCLLATVLEWEERERREGKLEE
jgi:hypothetical protein